MTNNHPGLFRPKYRDQKTGEVKESEVWWIRYSRGGRVYRESAGTKKVTVAKLKLDQRRGAVADGRPIAPQADRILIDELLTDVENDYKANNFKSLQALRVRTDKHVLPFFTGYRAASLTAADVQRYIVQRREEGASNASTNRELAILSRAFTLGVKRHKILTRPYWEVLKENNVRTGFFEQDQFETLCKHLPDDVAAAARFAFVSGWRMPSEVLTREWRHVDLNKGIVRLEPGETKNGKARIFPFTPELRDLFAQLRAFTDEFERKNNCICPFVFHHEGKLMLDSHGKQSKYFRKAWKEACKEAKLVGRICHDFRRTAIRNFERKGITREQGMKLSGHLTESVYRRYNIVTEQDLFDAVKKLSAPETSKVLAK